MFRTPSSSPVAIRDVYEHSPSPESSSTTHLPLPPTSTDPRQQEAAVRKGIAKYYWPRHFEHNPVDPASFIHRIMTDYANYERDVVGEWVEDMSPLYKAYKACLNHGVKNGTPRKAAEAKQYQGKTLAREPGVQDKRNHHSQLRTERTMLQKSHFSDSTPTTSLLTSHAPPGLTQSPAIVGVLEGKGEASTAPATANVTQGGRIEPLASQDSPESSHSVQLPQPRQPRRKPSRAKLSPEEYDVKFEELTKDDEKPTKLSIEIMQLTLDKAWEDNLKSLHPHLRDMELHSIPALAQKFFVEAIGILWMGELRTYFQKAILPENISNLPSLKKAVVEAAKKEKKITRLNNFVEKWDFLRFVWLVEALDSKDPFPNLKKVLPELIKFRELRNKTAHQDYGTSLNLGLDDEELELIIAFTRTYLPRINSLKRGSPEDLKIRKKLEQLQLCLFFGESDVKTITNTKITGRLIWSLLELHDVQTGRGET